MVGPAKKSFAIKPSGFYGSSLPRPRIFTDPKFNPERVDPPVPVTDPLLSWARDAHWSMGGLSFKRLRLQGRIEGNISRLRSQREKFSPVAKRDSPSRLVDEERDGGERTAGSVSTPAAPLVVKKRKKLLNLNDDDDDEIGGAQGGSVRTRRKLWDDFNRVAKESESDGYGFPEEMNELIPKRKTKKETVVESDKGSQQRRSIRTSPRLAKRRLN